jgi:hypothetical protein
MATINYDQNKKYFKRVSYKPGVIPIVIGVLFLLSGNAGAIVIGLLLAGAGGFYRYSQTAGRPTDQDIDNQVRAALGELVPRALKKLGLDHEDVDLINPIVVGGDYYGSLGSPCQVKKGKDGRFRSSHCEGVVIFFAKQELHAYKYQLSLVAMNESSEKTDVYFYRDVVSVSTESTSIPVPVVGETQKQVVMLEMFKLTTSGGTAIQCSMGAVDNGLSRDIQGARHLIREKKMHAGL